MINSKSCVTGARKVRLSNSMSCRLGALPFYSGVFGSLAARRECTDSKITRNLLQRFYRPFSRGCNRATLQRVAEWNRAKITLITVQQLPQWKLSRGARMRRKYLPELSRGKCHCFYVENQKKNLPITRFLRIWNSNCETNLVSGGILGETTWQLTWFPVPTSLDLEYNWMSAQSGEQERERVYFPFRLFTFPAVWPFSCSQ